MNTKSISPRRQLTSFTTLSLARFALALLALLLATAVPIAHAANNGTWTQIVSNNLWSVTGNWSNNIVADGLDYTADFSSIDITNDNKVQLDSARTIGNLKFGDTNTTSAGSWILDNNANGANILTLAVSSGSPTITCNPLGLLKSVTIKAALAGTQGLIKAGSGNLVISNPTNSYTGDTIISNANLQVAGTLGDGNYSGNITLYGSLTFNAGSPYPQILGGVISGTGNLSKNGNATLTLTQPNTFSGNTSLAGSGALILSTNLALQNSPLNVGATASSPVTLVAGVTSPTLGGLIGSLDLASVITSNFNFCTSLTLNPGASVSCSYTGVVANGASVMSLTKTSAGTQLLYGANTYSGDTIISGGTLKLSGSGSINNTTNIIIASGANFDVSTLTTALTLGASQTLRASATGGNTAGTNAVASGKNLTLSVGGLAFTAYGGGATAPLKLAGTGGSLAMNGAPVIITTTATLANSAYTLVATNGATTVTGTPSTLTINGASSPGWASVAVTSDQLILTISGSGMPAITAPASFPTALSAVVGTASSPTSVAISGSGLTAGITATAPTGLEVSSDNITYGPTATFSTSGGTLYARLSASAALGAYNSLNVVLSSAGAASVNVATTASGNVVGTPHWALAASGNWGTAANWFASTFASGSGNTADFSQVDITSDTTVHLDSSRTNGNLIFGNTDVAPAANWILDNNGNSGNKLTLAGGTPTVTVTNLGSGKVTISAEIDGTSGLTKAGNGTLTLSSTNAYSGGTTVSAGTLALSGSGTLGATNGALTLSGGTLDLGGTSQTNGAVSITGAATIQNGKLTGTNYVTSLTNGTATVSAALVSSGGVIVTNSGAGNLALSGTNNISGQAGSTGLGIEIKAGTLTISGGSTTVNTYGMGTYSGDNSSFNQTGGTVSIAGDVIVGWNSSPTFTLSGGSFTTGGNIRHQDGGNASVLTITNTATVTAGNVYEGAAGNATDSLTVNLNTGGTLVANRLYASASGSSGSHSLNVNFNGGTLKAGASTNLIDVPTGANSTNAFVNVTNKVGGIVIDSGTNTATILQPIRHDATLGATPDGGLTKLGSGTLALTNTNTYTGNTTINAGNLQGVVGGSVSNSTVILNASTATNGVSITDNTKSWTCAAFTAAAAGVLQFNFGVTPSTTVAPLVVSGAATFTATPTVSLLGSIPASNGAYPLMIWGSQSGTIPSAVTATVAMGKTASLSNSPTTLYLVIADSGVSPTLNFSAATPGQLQFNWSGSYKLQWLTNSAGLQTGDWVDYPMTNNPVTVTNNQTIPSAFFRLSQ